MLDDLIARVTDVADRYQGTDREGVAFSLHEVERSLRSAARQLESVQRSLR
jgi:phenylpyruvate tautomerase PptA (4-oxalocrotonate tautomerase family)